MDKYIIELPENLRERKRVLYQELKKIEGLLASATIKEVFTDHEGEEFDKALETLGVGKPHSLYFETYYEGDDEGGVEPWIDYIRVYDKEGKEIDLNELSEAHNVKINERWIYDYNEQLRDAMHSLDLEKLPNEIVFGDDV